MNNLDTVNKTGFFHNDRMFVCGMLVFYGLCTIGVIALMVWGLDRRDKAVSANATATGAVIATQNANVTATAVARATEQSQYEFIERFDTVSGRWLTGVVDSEYWAGRRAIQDEAYLWDVREVKKTFISWADFYEGDEIKDFDVYVDTKFINAPRGAVCSGFIFRKSPNEFDEGGYYFALCNNATVTISHRDQAGTWERIETMSYYGYRDEWNRLEVQARGSHFTFYINSELVYEMNDDRESIGGLALIMELNEQVSLKVLFDNFGFQSR